MSSTAADARASQKSVFLSPLVLLAASCVVLAAILTRPLTLAIGGDYWDLFIYFDAANRIFTGQIPNVDFFAPVGPLGYWLFALLVRVFPEGQPLLLVQWSLLLVTAPLFALVLWDVDRRSRFVALALLVPFLTFSILPFNEITFNSYPGVDGFGIYNRQICEILFVLASALIFSESRKVMATVVAGTVAALFLVKITGFVAAGMLCLFALAAGRITLRSALIAAAAFLLLLGGLEVSLGIVSAYIGNIWQLLSGNEGSILPRFLQAASMHFKLFGSLALLTAVLAVIDRRRIVETGLAVLRAPSFRTLAAFVDQDAFWLGLATFAGLFVETQNTGGHGFIFVWPVLVRILLRCGDWRIGRMALVLTLVAASSLPTFVDIIERTARTFIGQIKYVDLQSKNLGTLGLVNQRTEIMKHADVMMEAYETYPQTFQFIADNGELPGFTLFTEPDFQINWLKATDRGVDAIRAYEAKHGVRFRTIMNLNFVNPFPWLLDREAPLKIAIGADPSRAVPDPDAAVLASVAATDLVLYPLCPITSANLALLKLYEPGLTGHVRVHLSPCWDGFVREELAPSTALLR
nr:hypothetical protein [Aurantimonas sp. VKM B-3413]